MKPLMLLHTLIAVSMVSLPPLSSTADVIVQRNDHCIRKSRSSNQDYNDDLDERGEILELRAAGAVRWRGKRVIYRVENMPECNDGLTEGDVRRIVDAAAAEWNSIPRANVLLVNADALPADERNLPVDIHISFQPCKHKDPNLKFDSDFDPCQSTYGHAIHFGDIHLNTLMTWTNDASIREKDVRKHDLVRPNLYSIVLHEFGHTLGLTHSPDPSSVMFALFGGDRKHENLRLGTEDIARIQELYPPELSCKDKSVFCQRLGRSVCEKDAQRKACPGTCGDCTCDADSPDDYVKCSPDICSGTSELRELCKRTCGLCGGTCSGLPDIPDIQDIRTDAVFPVSAGSVVTVGCRAGQTLTGDVELTCVQGREYSYKEEPACQEEEGPEELTECEDKSRKCKKRQKKGKKCKSKWMRTNCQKTCNRCPAT